MSGGYVPDRGHLVWLDFDPQVGREQTGRRPAVVLSRAGYNRASGLAFVCPVTSRVKGYRHEVRLPPGLPVHGVVLADHAKSMDWVGRGAVYIGPLPPAVVDAVAAAVALLMQ